MNPLHQNHRIQQSIGTVIFAVLLLAVTGSFDSCKNSTESKPFLGPNLIQNPSFETGNKQPDAWEVVTGKSDEKPILRWSDYSNKSGKYIEVGLTKSGIAGWQQTVTLEPDSVYTLSGSIKAADVQGRGMGAGLLFPRFRWMECPAVRGTADWEKISVEMINAGFTSLDLVCALGAYGFNTGYASFDDISLTRKSNPALDPDTTAAVKIGSFLLRTDTKRGYLTSLKPDTQGYSGPEFLGSYPSLPYLSNEKDCFLGDIALYVKSGAEWKKMTTADSETHHQFSSRQDSKVTTEHRFNSPEFPEVISEFTKESSGNDLIWTVTLKNNTTKSMEIGGLDLPFHWNTNYCLFDPHDKASQKLLYTRRVAEHKHMGGHSGYMTVIPMDGSSPLLLVTPGNTDTSFEFTCHDPATIRSTRRDPGHWIHGAWPGLTRIALISAAVQEKNNFASPFGMKNSQTIHPGESRQYSIRFHWFDSADRLESEMGQLDLIGMRIIPGCAIPVNQPARMILYGATSPVQLTGVTQWKEISPQNGFAGTTVEFSLDSEGPVNLELKDASGKQGVAYLYGLPSIDRIMINRANFILEKQSFARPGHPLHLSILCYNNREKNVLADPNDMWGSGGYEGGITDAMLMALKNADIPNPNEIRFLESYIFDWLIGGIQNPNNHGVAWMVSKPDRTERGYNYIHVLNLYDAMARASAVWPGLFKHPASEYLELWDKTFTAFMQKNVLFQDLGLMGRGNIAFMPELFRRYALEGSAKSIETEIKKWAEYWNEAPAYPYGSELFYDNTGYESVFFYADAVGFNQLAQQTLNVTLAGRGRAPCWFWNDSDQRWWDAVRTSPQYNQFTDFGQNCHHYMTGLNGWMLLEAFDRGYFKDSPVPVGYSGILNSWARVQPDGFGAMCYCPDPSSDNYGFNQFTGDVGLGLWGNLKAARCCIIEDPATGWIAYGGKISKAPEPTDPAISVEPYPGMDHRIRFVKPRLSIDSEGPALRKIDWNPPTSDIILKTANPYTTECHSRITLKGLNEPALQVRVIQSGKTFNESMDLVSGRLIIERIIPPETEIEIQIKPSNS